VAVITFLQKWYRDDDDDDNNNNNNKLFGYKFVQLLSRTCESSNESFVIQGENGHIWQISCSGDFKQRRQISMFQISK
jgi:hypothetical protein